MEVRRFQYSDTSFPASSSIATPAASSSRKHGTTTYIRRVAQPTAPRVELFRRYRSALKKQKLRVVLPRTRLVVLKALIATLQKEDGLEWRELVDRLADLHPSEGDAEDRAT